MLKSYSIFYSPHKIEYLSETINSSLYLLEIKTNCTVDTFLRALPIHKSFVAPITKHVFPYVSRI